MATQTPFSLLYFDFLTGDFRGALPLAGVQWSSLLNGVGSLSGTIDMADPRIRALSPAALTAGGKTACFVDFGGTLMWGGVSLSPRPFTHSTRILSYTAQELWGYFARRVQATDYSAPPFSGITGTGSTMPIWNAAYLPAGPADDAAEWDPLLIAAQVITDALGYKQSAPIPNGNPLAMSVMMNGYSSAAGYLASGSATPSDDYISINFPFASMQYVGTMVQQLTSLGYGVGCDVGVDVAYSGSTGSPPVVTINLDYPRRGRLVSDSRVVVMGSGTGRDYTVTPDPSQMAWTLYETGGSSDIVVSQNVNPIAQGYALFESIVNRSQILSSNVSDILAQLGEGDLFLYSYPPVTFSVTVPLWGQDPAYGSFMTGDDVRFMLGPDEMFPSGIDSTWRITAYTVNVPDEGDATMTLTLSPPPVYPTAPYI